MDFVELPRSFSSLVVTAGKVNWVSDVNRVAHTGRYTPLSLTTVEVSAHSYTRRVSVEAIQPLEWQCLLTTQFVFHGLYIPAVYAHSR